MQQAPQHKDKEPTRDTSALTLDDILSHISSAKYILIYKYVCVNNEYRICQDKNLHASLLTDEEFTAHKNYKAYRKGKTLVTSAGYFALRAEKDGLYLHIIDDYSQGLQVYPDIKKDAEHLAKILNVNRIYGAD